MDTIANRLADLTPRQRGKLDALKLARQTWANASVMHAQAIRDCIDDDMTYGMLSEVLGVPRETIWRFERRYLTVEGRPNLTRRQREVRH